MSTRPDITAITQAGGALPIASEGNRAAFATVHPQWGGYCFPCVVSFDSKSFDPADADVFPCFDVQEWHDGDFSTDELVFERHYCDPTQVLDFAVTIMEQMAKCGYRRGILPIGPMIQRLRSFVDEKDERNRIAAWHEAGQPTPVNFRTVADYIRAGLPGWER